MRHFLLLVFLLGPVLPSCSQSYTPAVDGYVTKTVSSTDFSVDGLKIICDEKTLFQPFGKKEPEALNPWLKGPFLGEHLSVFGDKLLAAHAVRATRIVLGEDGPRKVAGFGVIERVLSPPVTSHSSILIRADGYPVQIDAKTASTFQPPLVSLADVGTNVWIVFAGIQGTNGVVAASRAVFRKNEIPKGEGKLRRKTDYDPAAVDPNHPQGKLSKAFIGVKLKKISPYPDQAMQERINRIGASLIPEYQRALPDSDPTKITFRFQLVDEPKWHDAATLPSGIVLIPKQAVERMENDSQVATILADNIACALLKQGYRAQADAKKILAADAALDVAGAFVPGLSLIPIPGNVMASEKIVQHFEEQSGRISLGLLADAGYDIHEAPRAWWLLAPNKPAEWTEIDIPYRAKYLYRTLGTTWRDYQPAGR